MTSSPLAWNQMRRLRGRFKRCERVVSVMGLPCVSGVLGMSLDWTPMYSLNFCESRLPRPPPVVARLEEASRPHRQDAHVVVVMRVGGEVPGGTAEPPRAPSLGVRQVTRRARLLRLHLGLCLMLLMPHRGAAPHPAVASVMTSSSTMSDLEMRSEQRRRFLFQQAARTAPKEPHRGTRRVFGTSS